MSRVVWGLAFALIALPARADDKEDVKNAAKKLGESSYSWTATPKSEGGAGGGGGGGGGRRMQTGPTDGKSADGWITLTRKQGETTMEAVVKGDKAAVKATDGWKLTDEFPQGGGGGGGGQRDPAAGFARSLRAFKAPAADAEALVDKVGELKKGEDGLYAGDLTEDGAKSMLGGGMGGGGGRGGTVSEPKGSAKFWVKDGVIVKYEVNVQGKMTFGDREVAINRTTTVELKDIGATKVEVPEDAKKKFVD